MVADKKKPAPVGRGAGFGVICLAARDTETATPDILRRQAATLRRRFGFAPEMAAIVAALAFGEVRP